jgi:hypothetical protein
MQQFFSLLSWPLFTALHVSGIFRPSSGAQRLQWQPLVLTSHRGDSRVVFVVGPAGPTTNTTRLSPRCEGKTRGCYCSRWAPDDGRKNARNMLSSNVRIINRKIVAPVWWSIWILQICSCLCLCFWNDYVIQDFHSKFFCTFHGYSCSSPTLSLLRAPCSKIWLFE